MRLKGLVPASEFATNRLFDEGQIIARPKPLWQHSPHTALLPGLSSDTHQCTFILTLKGDGGQERWKVCFMKTKCASVWSRTGECPKGAGNTSHSRGWTSLVTCLPDSWYKRQTWCSSEWGPQKAPSFFYTRGSTVFSESTVAAGNSNEEVGNRRCVLGSLWPNCSCQRPHLQAEPG